MRQLRIRKRAISALALHPVSLRDLRDVVAAACVVLTLTGCVKPMPDPSPNNPAQSAPVPPLSPGDGVTPGKTAETTVPTQADAVALLYPYKPGNTWVMQITSGGETYQAHLSAVKAPANTGEAAFAVETKRGDQVVNREVYHVDKKGVYLASYGSQTTGQFIPPMPILQLPFTLDSRWEWEGAIDENSKFTGCKAVFRLSGPETLKTPAKVFPETYRLDQTITLQLLGGDVVTRSTQWYAPKVGLVKQVINTGDAITMSELVSYKVSD